MPAQRPRIADVKNKVDQLERRLQLTWLVTGVLIFVVGHLVFSG